MASNTPFLLTASEQYDGSNWLEFKTKIRAAAKQRGVLGYLDGTIPCPSAAPPASSTPSSPTAKPAQLATQPTTFASAYWGSLSPTYEEWQQRDAWTQGLITLNVKNPIGLGVKLDGTAAETYASIATVKDAISDLGCITAEQELNAIKYSDGSDMDEHISALRSAWTKANGQGAGITDTKFRMVVLKSLPSTWLPFIGSLYAETTSAGVIARVTAHSKMILSLVPAHGSSLKALSTTSGSSKLRNPHLKCSNCNKSGHEMATCFQKGGGKEGQFPDWWRGKRAGEDSNQTHASAANSTKTSHIAASAISSTNDDTYYAFSTHQNVFPTRNEDGSLDSFADSAASEHYFADRSDFHDYIEEPHQGETATGDKFRILGRGTVRKVAISPDGKRTNVSFTEALHAPDFTHNLVSIGRLDRMGYTVKFGGGKVSVLDTKGNTIMEGSASGTMYRLKLVNPTPDDILPTAYLSRSLTKAADLETWHRRLGHVSEDTILKMMRGEMVIGLTNETLTRKCTAGKCEDCIFGKHARRPFDYEVVQVKHVLGLVCIDLWGPAQVKSNGGKLYMMLFTDAHGRKRDAYFIANKTAETTIACLRHYKETSERQTGRRMVAIRTDNGGEFANRLWEQLCEDYGITHEFTTAYSSAANGIGERGNRIVLDMSRTLLHDAGLPGTFWAEAAATSVYILNRLPCAANNDITPHESWTGEKPDVSHLRPFGCVAFVKIPDETNGGKLSFRSIKCILIGYAGIGQWRVMDRSTGRIFRSRDVIFEEGVSHRTLEAIKDEVDGVEDGEDGNGEPGGDGHTVLVATGAKDDDRAYGLAKSHTAVPAQRGDVDLSRSSSPVSESSYASAPSSPVLAPTPIPAPVVPPAPRRSGRIAGDAPTIERVRLDAPLAMAAEHVLTPGDEHWVPRNASEAISHGGPEWKAAMQREYDMMLAKGVWKLVERPKGARTMKCRWVFANKLNSDGKVIGHKARIVAKGFTQIPGLHFTDTFAGVVRYESVRMLVSTAVCLGMFLFQGDYVSAYLNSPIPVPILMEQIEGWEVSSLDGCVRSDTVRVPRQDGLVYELTTYIPPGGDVSNWTNALLDPSALPIPPSLDPPTSFNANSDDPSTSADEKSLVVVLDRALYGTVDGARNWSLTLSAEMTDLGYYESRADQSVRTRLRDGEHTITATYSDDVTGATTTKAGYRTAMSELGRKFEVKDMGELKFVIGMCVERNWEQGSVKVHVRPFLERTLDRFRMADCAPKYTPLPPGISLTSAMSPTTDLEKEAMANIPYREALGCIMYAQYVARPDLSFAVALLSRFASNPGQQHWAAVLHVLAYIKATLHFALMYGGDGHQSIAPIGYTDADYASDVDTRRSYAGYLFLQGGGPTSWSTKLLPRPTLSTSESEYMAMTRAAQQLEWMHAQMSEMGLPQPRPAVLRADNQSSIYLARNQKHNARVKHIDVREHYIRDRVASGDIAIEYVPTTQNLADLLTKSLPRITHMRLCHAMRLCESEDGSPSQGEC